MANRHYGKIGDVWKHLVLAELLQSEAPEACAETGKELARIYAGSKFPDGSSGVLEFRAAQF